MLADIETAARRICEISPNRSTLGNPFVTLYTINTYLWDSRQTSNCRKCRILPILPTPDSLLLTPFLYRLIQVIFFPVTFLDSVTDRLGIALFDIQGVQIVKRHRHSHEQQ